MTTYVVINFGSGSLTKGCNDITAALYTDTEQVPERCPPASLPPVPELAEHYRQYQVFYGAFYGRQQTRELKIQSSGLTNFSKREFDQVAQSLERGLQDWLNAPSFQTTYQAIGQHLQQNDEIRVILETGDPLLRRLPWQRWQFFEDYPFAELALSMPAYGRLQTDSQTRNGRVRILAIFGNCQGLDLKADRKAISSLPGADVVVLPEAAQGTLTREQLNEALWDHQGWDILFFAGHSMTDAQTGIGKLQINARDALSIEQLRYALKAAINRGLTLAIFNSCDGLGLAQGLSDLNIPQVIVMREMVPDKVAQKFFAYFLEAFARSRAPQSLYQSVRQARMRLQGLENDYPYASWLPVLSQNPTTPVKTWQQLRYPQGPRQPRLSQFLVMLMIVSIFCLGIRPMGLLQPYELMGYDHFLNRPLIGPIAGGKEDDNNPIFIVEITEADLNEKIPGETGSESISDAKLLKLLVKLKDNGATTIGSDILRVEQDKVENESNQDEDIDRNKCNQDKDKERDESNQDGNIDRDGSNQMSACLQEHLQTIDNFFGICRHGNPDTSQEPAGVPPPSSAKDQYNSFSNLKVDPDGVVRRNLVSLEPGIGSLCPADRSLSTNVALDYINQQQLLSQTQKGEMTGRTASQKDLIPSNVTESPASIQDLERAMAKLRLGTHPKSPFWIKGLTARLGPYQGTKLKEEKKDFGGVQLLLKYRYSPPGSSSFLSDSLENVFKDPSLAKNVEGRIVLIGRTESKDEYPKPFPGGYWDHEPTPGVFMHAHMAHQMIQLHQGKSFMDVLPLWGEILWIWGWTTLGGLGLWFTQKQPLRYLLMGVGLMAGLYLCCWGLFLMGLWVPILPPALALAITGILILSSAGISSQFSSRRWRPKRR